MDTVIATQPKVGEDSGKAIVKRNIYVPGYLDAKTVGALAVRLETMLPYAHKLTKTQLQALAQGALMHRLNPLLGEIWYIPGDGGLPGGLYVGVAGRVRKGREQLWREGSMTSSMWWEFRDVTDEAELARYAFPAGALVIACELRDSVTLTEYQKLYAEFSKIVPVSDKQYEHIQSMIGRRPIVDGYGVLTAEEVKDATTTKDGRPRKNMFAPVEKARKRALVAALKRRFHFDMVVPDVEDLPSYIADTLDAVLDRTTEQWVVEPRVETTPSVERDGNGTGEAERQADALLNDRTLICATVGCMHPIEAHGLDHACEIPGCKCKKFIEAQPLTGVELQAALHKNKRALGRDGGGID